MNIGSLYRVKKFYWLLFPTREIAAVAHRPAVGADATAAAYYCPTDAAAYWSRAYNCEVIYFSQEMLIVFLEEDGKYKKVLTSDGRIGWTWFSESYNDCFQEMKTE